MTDRSLRALALLAAAALVAPAARADNFGRETFPNEAVTTTISPTEDTDDFVFEGAAGFKLTASVKRAKGSLLAPILELVGPGGTVLGLADGVVAKPPKATSGSLKAVLPTGGRYALRIRAQTTVGSLTVLTPWDIAVQSDQDGNNFIDPATDLLHLENHGLVDGDPVTLVSTTDTLPGGLAVAGDYFVVQSTTGAFKLSATAGGAPVDLTSAGVGTQVLEVTRVPSQVDPGTDTIVKAGHGLTDGTVVRVVSTTDTLPGGIAAGTDYYVVAAAPGTFKLAALPGGAAVNLTSEGAGILELETVRGSTGACTLKWKLTAAKIGATKGLTMAANETKLFPFSARGGALLSWTLKWKGEGGPSVKRILDPDGNEVAFVTDDLLNPWLVRKATSEIVKKFPLPDDLPGGTYNLEVGNPIVPSIIGLSIKVALPKALKAAPVMTVEEPVLETIDPASAVASTGVGVTLTGRGFDSAPQAILFGDSPATDVLVTQGVTESDPDTVHCTVPVGSGTVAVQFVAADGEVGVLPDPFTFRPMPVITSFNPSVGPAGGGIEMTITGTGFETLELTGIYDVTINNVPAWPGTVRVTSPTTLVCKIPANPSGPRTVVVRNVHSSETAYRAQAPGMFNYSASLGILYLTPDAVPANFAAAGDIAIYGTAFGATDTVYIETAPGSDTFDVVPTTPIFFPPGTTTSVIGHTIAAADVPLHDPGKFDVKVVAASLAFALKQDGLSYFTFADATAGNIPAGSATDDWGGVSTAGIDDEQDGVLDYLVITHSQILGASRPGTRVLVNDGAGTFTDGTAAAFPAFNPANDDYAGSRVVSGRFSGDGLPDFFLSRPGTGTSARKSGDKKSVDAWARIFFSDGAGAFSSQVHAGIGSKFSIPGLLVYGAPCFQFDFDFRSVDAAVGDLDGDLDQDVVLVNDESIEWYKGVNCAFVWVTCLGYYPSCYSFTTYPNGSALRICTLGSTGGVFDRTKELLAANFSAADDFRAVATAIGDMDADFLNDIVIVHDEQPGTSGTPIPCTRVFKQKSTGTVVTFSKLPSSFVPLPSTDTDDDWRGEAVAIPDLNADLYRDMVLSVDGAMFNGGTYSTRVLIQNTATGRMEDKTAEVLGGVLPVGDDGRAASILNVDLDKDGDADMILSTPTDAGPGNRKTRFLLNTGKSPTTGLPILIDASALFPAYATDDGAATSVHAADVDGDGDLDLLVTDAHYPSGPVQTRTRLWKQVR